MSVKQLDPRMTQEWDLFSSDVVDETTTSFEYVRFPYLASGASNQIPATGDIQIQIHDMASWLLINKAFLEVKYKITKSDDTALSVLPTDKATTTQLVGLTNGGWNIFREIQWKINNKTVGEVDNVG